MERTSGAGENNRSGCLLVSSKQNQGGGGQGGNAGVAPPIRRTVVCTFPSPVIQGSATLYYRLFV